MNSFVLVKYLFYCFEIERGKTLICQAICEFHEKEPLKGLGGRGRGGRSARERKGRGGEAQEKGEGGAAKEHSLSNPFRVATELGLST